MDKVEKKSKKPRIQRY